MYRLSWFLSVFCCYALWSAERYHAIFLSNQTQNQDQSSLISAAFSAFEFYFTNIPRTTVLLSINELSVCEVVNTVYQKKKKITWTTPQEISGGLFRILCRILGKSFKVILRVISRKLPTFSSPNINTINTCFSLGVNCWLRGRVGGQLPRNQCPIQVSCTKDER